MIRRLVSTVVAAAALATAMTPVVASAHEHDDWQGGNRGGYGWQGGGWQGGDRYEHGGDERDYRHDEHRNYGQGYGRYDRGQGYYAQPGYDVQPSYYAQSGYGRGYDQRGYYRHSRCHNDGATGTILGAIAGGLIGNGVAGRGDRTLGTVLGAGGGAFAGRAIDRNC